MPLTPLIHKWVLVVLVLSGNPPQPSMVMIPYMGTTEQCEIEAEKLSKKWMSEAPIRVFTSCVQTWYRP